MRVLLDENIDRLLKPEFSPEHEVLTVQEQGWSGLKNGVLLRAADGVFDVFVTMDKNLEHQQALDKYRLAVVVIRAHSNAYAVVAPLIPEVNGVLRVILPGQVVYVPPRASETD